MKTMRNTTSDFSCIKGGFHGSHSWISSSGIVLHMVIFLIIFSGHKSFSQGVGISEVSIVPDASAILELRSTVRGFLAPWMTTAQRDAIPSPATGLLVYNTSTNQFNYYNGSSWIAILNIGTGVTSVNGTPNRISIGGTPTIPDIDIAGNYVGQGTINTLGTITSGIWNSTPVEIDYGGTGQSTAAGAFNALSPMTSLGDFIYGGTTGAGTRLPGNITTTPMFLKQTGTGAASTSPAWAALSKTDVGLGNVPDIDATDAGNISSGVLPIARGGTGSSTLNLWTLTGNSGTTAGTNFIGTTDGQDIVFKANNVERARIDNSTGDIIIGDANSATIRSQKELVLRMDGDLYGTSILRLRNRTAENGAIFENPHATTTLVDFIFRTSVDQRNIRYEARAVYARSGAPSFHIGGLVPDDPTLSIGDNYSAFNRPVRIGSYTTPTAMLHLTAGTAIAGTAPLKFTSGAFLTTPENGAVEYNGTNYFVTNNTGTRYTLAKTFTNTASLNFPDTNPQNSSDLFISVPGAALGDAVVLGIPNTSNNANSNYSAWVSAADIVTVRFNNYSGAAIDPVSGDYRVSVLKY